MKVRARVNGQNVEVIPDWTPEQQADWDMSQDTTEYVLIQDDDCHWYVCPADKERKAEAFFEASHAYWEPGSNRLHQGKVPVQPDWLLEIGGSPTLVKFTGYRIDK